jgi:hypothetical protein
MSELNEKIKQMQTLVREISDIDEGVGQIFNDSFIISVNTLNQVYKSGGAIYNDDLDISDRIAMVSNALGLDIEELVKHILEKDFMSQEAQDIMQKAADEETLSFITSDEDIDDYEKFIEENKVKENLDFLKGEL